MPWTPALERRTVEYLASRRQGTQDWIWFHDRDSLDDPPAIDDGYVPAQALGFFQIMGG